MFTDKEFNPDMSSKCGSKVKRPINCCVCRDNFMDVDVFMNEMSYQQITQQIAYELTSLWSTDQLILKYLVQIGT